MEVEQSVKMALSALTQTRTFSRVQEVQGKLAGHWLYLVFQLRDASAMGRPVFLGSGPSTGLKSADEVQASVIQVLHADQVSKGFVADQVSRCGGHVLCDAYRAGLATVDGQKFGVERPTAKARYSRKYFGRGKGVVAYTLLCNHVPLQGWLIGAHELEAHHVFDLWYRNTCEIVPEAITGDMHSVNKANFAILDWFGRCFEPRFTDLDDQLGEIYCTGDPAIYAHFLVKPAGQVDLQAIADEQANIDRIVATLGLKEMTQGTLVRKLCTYDADPTRRAIFEYDRLVRSIYTLRYLRNPKLQRHVHRSQNRIESYHQLRSAIAQVGGKKGSPGAPTWKSRSATSARCWSPTPLCFTTPRSCRGCCTSTRPAATTRRWRW